ncbi:cyclin-T2-like [Limulus polyphemus]|uniref:Cyclin-T2-like n=1 Tax=Limulus polyphemus TaxID=6850 RepID=A0ABM1T8G6_LIMPO|nr:cyclin-T2-like [Limulus polyphemus]
MLQTLGFDIAIEHPHTYVVKCCQLVRASKDLAQTSYFMATNSLHLTTMCLQYRPTFVACVCIHLACKWSSWEIPKSSEGKEWFWYVDKSVTSELLEELTSEFLAILDKCPSKLKRKMSLAKELLPEEKKTKVGTSQPSCKEVIKQNHVNSQQSSKSHQPKLSSSKKQIKKSPGQPSVNGKENPDHSFHLEVTSIPTLSSSPSENISPSKKVKPEGSVTISLAAYREMKEKRDKERQTIKGQQDDIRKQVSASGSEERKAGKPQAHIVNKKGSQNIKSSEDTSESLGNENSERKKSEIVSALLNELSDDEQNGQQSNDFIRKPGSLPHPRMPKDSLQSSTAFSTKRQDLVELSRPQTINSDDLVKSFNVNSKESSTKLVIKSHRDQRPANLDQKSTVNTCRISGSNKSSRTNKHAKIKISKKPHQHSVSQASQDKTLSSNRKSPHLETLPQASANTNAVSRQSENGANSDGCKSAKISTSVDLTVNPKHKHKHSEKEKSSKSVSEHQNTSISSPGLKMKIPKEKLKLTHLFKIPVPNQAYSTEKT